MTKLNRRSLLRRLAFGRESADKSLKKPPQKHILVCVFLRGGADTLNMIIPNGDDSYFRARPTLGIKTARKGDTNKDLAVAINDFYSFHPRMRLLLPAFEEERLLIVQSVGSDNTSGSHFEAQDQMEHGEMFGRSLTGGWLGRHLYATSNEGGSPFSAVSLGVSIPESLRGAPSVTAISAMEDIRLDTGGAGQGATKAALAALYGNNQDYLGRAGEETLALLTRVEALGGTSYKPENGADYGDSDFAAHMREVARIAKAGIGLEVACVDLGGWDTHFFQGAADGLQAGLIETLAQGLSAFDKDVASMKGRITTLLITEFGRRTYENSSMGTDHGRGFALIAIGRRIKGGRVLG
ncbi:MAG: DUF1501 domain-containing protein, partial [Candidatus Obscuribacterales bacterium]|nr:DUF1501 domain-containing protein [Candidatus Obscuribacterales bacterium]